MTLPVFKVGDRVMRGTKEGAVAVVVPAGIHIELACDDVGVAKPDGANGVRDHISYVVRSGSKNYWPRVSWVRAVGSVADAPEPTEVALARRRIGDGWNMADMSAPMEDALVLLAEVDRLRGLLAGGSR